MESAVSFFFEFTVIDYSLNFCDEVLPIDLLRKGGNMFLPKASFLEKIHCFVQSCSCCILCWCTFAMDQIEDFIMVVRRILLNEYDEHCTDRLMKPLYNIIILRDLDYRVNWDNTISSEHFCFEVLTNEFIAIVVHALVWLRISTKLIVFKRLC